MWTADLSGTTYYVKGPSCRVGRSPDNCIELKDDKSVSRNHAKLIIENGILSVMDLGSTFGTFLFNEIGEKRKLQPNELYIISNSQTILFGNSQSKISFLNTRLIFCVTRIEKIDKDRLKKNVKSIGATIVNKAEDATHIVSNKFSATVKMLTALVLKKEIITGDWLIFSETIKTVEIILPCSKYSPFKFDQISTRTQLLKDLTVVLLEEADEQYEIILTSCGAEVIKMYKDVKDPSDLLCSLRDVYRTTLLRRGAARDGESTWCVFKDECRETQVELISGTSSWPFQQRWLSAGMLANAVIEVKTPPLLLDIPSQRSVSQMQQSFRSTSMHASRRVDQCPAVQSQLSVSLQPQHYDPPAAAAAATAVTSGTAAGRAIVTASKQPSVVALPPPIGPAAAAHSSQILKQLVPVKLEKPSPLKAPVAVVSSIFDDLPYPTAPMPVRAAAGVRPPPPPPVASVMTMVAPLPKPVANSRVKQETLNEASKRVPAVEPLPTRADADSAEQPFSFAIPSSPPEIVEDTKKRAALTAAAPREAKRPRVALLDEAGASNRVSSQPPDTRQISPPPLSLSSSLSLSSPLPSACSQSEDGWLRVGRGRGSCEHTDQENSYCQPEIVESILLRSSAFDSLSLSPHCSLPPSRLTYSRNFKKFRKNIIRRVTAIERVSSRAMERVLPRESEREAQLRMDADMEEEREAAAEQMFSDRFGAKAPASNKPKRKSIF